MIKTKPRWLVLAPSILLFALPVPSSAQDAEMVLEAVEQAVGGEVPNTLRITAAGSGYAAEGDDSSPLHFQIESYTWESNLTLPAAFERLIRVRSSAGVESLRQPESRTVTADSPWSEQYALWTTPYGFLEGARASTPSVEQETIFGTDYRVVSFTTTSGRTVSGYINDQNLIAKTQTRFDDPVRGDTDFEAAYLEWAEFDGVKFPTIIIQKRDKQLSRILVVSKVEAGVTLTEAVSQTTGGA